MRTDAERCEILVRWMEVSCSPDDAGATGLTQVEAKTMLDFVEACEAGYRLGLRGRELVDSAMNAVRFDEEPEKACEVTEQMVAERQDRERLDDLERFVDDGDLDYIRGEEDSGAKFFVIQLDGSRGYANGKGVSLRSALDNLRDVLDARDDARAALSRVPEA
jgi:hypothetical protein